MALGEFWKDYCTEKWNYNDTGTTSSPCAYSSVYICPSCGTWVTQNEYHVCSRLHSYYYPDDYPCYYPHYPVENKTEKAFHILKVFVEEKIIVEPDSYKKFCDLVEKIAEKL